MLSYLTDMEGVLKEYAAADAIAEEIINDKHQVMCMYLRVDRVAL